MIGGTTSTGTEALKPKSLGATLGGRLGRYFGRYWIVLLIVLALMIANVWVQVISPELFGQAVDCYLTPAAIETVTEADEATSVTAGGAAAANCWYADVPPDASRADLVRGLGGITLTLALLFAAGAVFGGLMFYLMAWSGQHILRQLQVEVFDQLQRLSLGFYTRHDSGDLMSRITNDTSTIQQAIGFALVQVFSGGLLLVWLAYRMLTLNPAFGLLSLAILPVMALVTMWFSNRRESRSVRRAKRWATRQHRSWEENISGVQRGAGLQPRGGQHRELPPSNATNRDANIRAVAYTAARSRRWRGWATWRWRS